jgi:hypothetical protein
MNCEKKRNILNPNGGRQRKKKKEIYFQIPRIIIVDVVAEMRNRHHSVIFFFFFIMFGDSEYVLFAIKIQTLNGITRRVFSCATRSPFDCAHTHDSVDVIRNPPPFFF